jgi:hypothetical protein
MVFINEWLPNPVGLDTEGEWVELFNGGNEAVSLDGWKLVSGDSKFSFAGKNIASGGYLVLRRSETKLVLKNIDGSISLYDKEGRSVDSESFLGSAPEGKSYSRLAYSAEAAAKAGRQGYGGQGAQSFTWADPTPGAVNKIALNNSIVSNNYPTNIPLNENLGAVEFWSMLLGTAVVLTAIVVFVLKRSDGLSKLFFARDEEIR